MICEECSFIEDNGQFVCQHCGAVSDERILENKIPLTTKENEDNNIQLIRVGMPQREIPKKNLTNNKKINDILSKSNFNISYDIKKEVIKIYNEISSKENKRGKKNFNGKKNLPYIIKGLYYYVCKKKHIGKSFTEIAMEFLNEEDNKSKRKIRKEEERIIKGFNDIKLEIENFGTEDNDNITMLNYINTYLGKDESKFKIKKLAEKIITNFDEKGFLSEKHLKTKAGLALLLSFKLFQENINDKRFYIKFSSKYILRNAFMEIKDNLKEIIPDDLKDKLSLLEGNNLFV